jgi:hypothetical protein
MGPYLRQNQHSPHRHILIFISYGKDKNHPRTVHEGPEGEQRYNSTLSLTSALDGGGWPTPRPGTHCRGGWMGPTDLDRCGKSRPHRDSTPDRPARSESLYRLSYLGPYIYLISISILYSLSRQDLQTLYLSFTFTYQNTAYILLIKRTVPTVFYWLDTLVKGEARDIQDSVHAEQCVQD